MPTARVGALELEYEEFGAPHDPLVLLVMGQGGQLTSWDEGFCRLLAGRGFRLVRYDNRDIGLSTKFEGAPILDLAAVLNGDQPVYSLDDMAEDAIGLLDFLEVDRAHVAGLSMGGFIAQIVAIRHPQRVLSLASIMSGAGGDALELPTPEAMERMTAPAAQTRAEQIERSVEDARRANPGFPFDETRARRMAEEGFERSWYPDGAARHLVACIAAPSRVDELRSLRMPTVVIHGSADDVLPPKNAQVTADAIPGATMLVIDGMGHDLPPGAWARVVDAIAANALSAGAVEDASR